MGPRAISLDYEAFFENLTKENLESLKIKAFHPIARKLMPLRRITTKFVFVMAWGGSQSHIS